MAKDHIINCAHCGHDHTHVRVAAVFERVEDAPSRMTCHGNKELILRWRPRNPSSRREATAFLSECEECGKYSQLSITQHKGVTTLDVMALDI